MYGQDSKMTFPGPAISTKEGPGIPESLEELSKVCEELTEIIARLDSKLDRVKVPYPAVAARDEAQKSRSPLYNFLQERLNHLHHCVQQLVEITGSLDL